MKISNDTKKVVQAKRKMLLAKENVVAVGAGQEWKGGKKTGKEAAVVFVKKKLPSAQLTRKDLVPSSVTEKGVTVPTDVIEVGEIKALGVDEHRNYHRPLKGGISIGHYNITAGTLGLFVEKDGEVHILSNNHVVADSNKASIGDPIYQPGPFDGGRPSDTVAHLSHVVPMKFDGSENLVDCALARVDLATVDPEEPPVEPPAEPPPPPKKDDDDDGWCPVTKAFVAASNLAARVLGSSVRVKPYRVSKQDVTVNINGDTTTDNKDTAPTAVEFDPTILGLGDISGEIKTDVSIGDLVQKAGRTTGFTQDEILAVDVTVDVSYGSDGTARFTGQMIAGNMSAGGDSGSAMFDADKNLVGLLFAGSDTITIFTPADVVFNALGIDKIVTGI